MCVSFYSRFSQFVISPSKISETRVAQSNLFTEPQRKRLAEAHLHDLDTARRYYIVESAAEKSKEQNALWQQFRAFELSKISEKAEDASTQEERQAHTTTVTASHEREGPTVDSPLDAQMVAVNASLLINVRRIFVLYLTF